MAENVAYALSDCSYHSLIFCSSIDVYGRPPSDNPITEQTRLNPAGYYGHSKLVSEYILEKELGYDRGLAILRLPGIYSLDETDPSVLGTIYKDLKRNLPVRLSGGGKQIRTYLNIIELSAIVERIFFSRWSGLLNLGSAKSYSLWKSSEILKEFLVSSSEIKVSAANGSEFDIVISNDKLKGNFPDITPIHLEQYLRCYL
jgi:nucleoside-diphosphate-sugar epimerase